MALQLINLSEVSKKGPTSEAALNLPATSSKVFPIKPADQKPAAYYNKYPNRHAADLFYPCFRMIVCI